MSLTAILAIGFFLGMRHATDADHVVAVSTIVSGRRTLRAAAPIGVLWGIGHTLTILTVGGGIIVFGIVVPPRVGLGMELCVAVMLVLLGVLNVRAVVRDSGAVSSAKATEHAPMTIGTISRGQPEARSIRPLAVGIVHGLAGSAAVALLVLGAIRDAVWAVAYLAVFGVGTIVGMLVITTALAVPMVAAATRFDRLHRRLGMLTGLASIAFGAVLVYEIGFVHGLFIGHVQWTPQ
jgi:sulfite exporter TauE/SafE